MEEGKAPAARSFNVTETDGDVRDEYLAKWEIIVLATILYMTLVGNTLLLFALYLKRHHGRRRKFTRMQFFILHLSTADLITGVFNVLPQLVWDITFRFQGGNVLCKLVKFMQPLGPYLSSYVLMATAIDRYHAICHPLSYCSSSLKRSKIMVYSAWAMALIFCIPQVIVFSYQEVTPKVWDCWAVFDVAYGERIYVTWYSTMVFLLPFTVLLYTYTGICIGIWRSNKMSGAENWRKKIRNDRNFLERNRSPFISKAMINTMRQTIVVISLYAITSVPFIGCQLWATWDPSASSSLFITGPAFTILSLLSSLTSCVNPWIYLSFNRELRAALKNNVRCRSDYSTTYDQELHPANSTETSSRSSLISRIFSYAGSVIFR